MEGVIGVESTVGTGTVFWVELLSTAALVLPVAGETAAVVQPSAASGACMRTLLYVEDNSANLKLVEKLVARRQDLRLLTAVDGSRGVELARSCIFRYLTKPIKVGEFMDTLDEALESAREDQARIDEPLPLPRS